MQVDAEADSPGQFKHLDPKRLSLQLRVRETTRGSPQQGVLAEVDEDIVGFLQNHPNLGLETRVIDGIVIAVIPRG